MNEEPDDESVVPMEARTGTAEEVEDPSEEATEVDAELVVFRVFDVNRNFNDRPDNESWTWSRERGPAAGDTTTVTVGDVTSDFIAAVRALQAWRPFVLNQLFGGKYRDKSPEELEAVIEDLLPDEDTVVAQRVKLGQTYITVTLRRKVRVLASDGQIHRWLTSIGPLENVSEFVESAGEYLDVTGARLMGPLGREVAPNSAVYRSNRAFLFAPGRTPMITDIQLRVGEVTATVFGKGWKSIDWQPVSDLLDAPHADARLIKSASRWLWAATDETNDKLRRFLFAFFGLEILANKCGKQFEQDLIDRLSSELDGAPLNELFWPSLRDADSPWRNLVFRFTVMALWFNPDGATHDVTLFKRLASARNDLAHGAAGDHNIDGLPGSEAIVLLRDYLQRVVALGDASPT